MFLLLEDEFGTVNLIVPPPVYERHRLACAPSRWWSPRAGWSAIASAGGAINVVVRRLRRARRAGDGVAEVVELPTLARRPPPPSAARAGRGRAQAARRPARAAEAAGLPRGRAGGPELRAGRRR